MLVRVPLSRGLITLYIGHPKVVNTFNYYIIGREYFLHMSVAMINEFDISTST
jgi:hypothetical protein